MKPTTFTVTIEDDGENYHVIVQLVTRGDIALGEAIAMFAGARTPPDEVETGLKNGRIATFTEHLRSSVISHE